MRAGLMAASRSISSRLHPDLLQLGEEAGQDGPLDGIASHKIEDVDIRVLPDAVDTSHALFLSVRIPGDIVALLIFVAAGSQETVFLQDLLVLACGQSLQFL